MCGRYTLTRDSEELVEAFGVPPLTFEHRPRYNIAPGQSAPILAQDRKGRRIGPLVWGLLPSWFDKPGKGFINARSETVTQTPSFRDSIVLRRCLVPADGFYEWKKDGEAGTPFWFHRGDRGLFTMAAIWDHWEMPGHEPRYTFAILTMEANESVRDVHDRMPVVVAPEDRDEWLDREADFNRVLDLLEKHEPWMRHRVSSRVGSPRIDEPDLIQAV